jgi:hypothetical protein
MMRFPISSKLGPSGARHAPKLREPAISAVLGGEIGKSDSYTIYAGSLDDPSAFHPTFAIFAAGRPDRAIIPRASRFSTGWRRSHGGARFGT